MSVFNFLLSVLQSLFMQIQTRPDFHTTLLQQCQVAYNLSLGTINFVLMKYTVSWYTWTYMYMCAVDCILMFSKYLYLCLLEMHGSYIVHVLLFCGVEFGNPEIGEKLYIGVGKINFPQCTCEKGHSHTCSYPQIPISESRETCYVTNTVKHCCLPDLSF